MGCTHSRLHRRVGTAAGLLALAAVGCGESSSAGSPTGSAGRSDTAGASAQGGGSTGGNVASDAGGANVTGGSAQGGGAEVAGSANGNAGSAHEPPGDCSEMPVRTQAPAGKEAFVFAPQDEQFPFSGHWVGVFSDDPRYIGATTLGDFDHDGDLDFADGQREDVGGGALWWEYCSPDHWSATTWANRSSTTTPTAKALSSST